MKDTRTAYLKELERLWPLMAKAYAAAMRENAGAIDMAGLQKAIEARDVGAALRALNVGPGLLAPVVVQATATYLAGGQYQYEATKVATRGLPAGLRVAGSFDPGSARAAKWAQDFSSRMVVMITDDTRALVRTAIDDGLAAGRSPFATAVKLAGRADNMGRRSGGIVGLHPQFQGYVDTARAELSDPESMANYLTRTRRDKRFDATVRKAIRDGKPLARQDVERIAGRYADRLLALRGETIARSETIEALNTARRHSMKQVIEDPTNGVTAADVTRVWDATGDSKTRPAHSAMEGQAKPEGEPFEAPDGSRLMSPGDRSLGASGAMTIVCRCYMQLKVDALAILVRAEGR